MARLASARRYDIPELMIRIEQAIQATGMTELLEPALERLREMDEGMAKSQDEVLELYQAVGGKPRKEQANER
jgi:C4-type Zn-finger protein